jgi:hypothetical protein
MRIFDYRGEWNAQPIGRIIRRSAKLWETFLLVMVQDRGDEAAEHLSDLMPHLVSRRLTNAWPGTVQFSDKKHELLKFAANPASLNILVDTVLPSMFEESAPVEDLSLLRGDGRPLFVTIIHERDAYFKAEPSEVPELINSVGSHHLSDAGEDQMADERY